MAENTQTRKARAADTRAENQRIPEWVPPSKRVALASNADVRLRWVRTDIAGKDDHENVEQRLLEGFEIVSPSDPLVADQVAKGVLKVQEGRIVQKGQVLCKMSAQVAKQRQAYYTKEANLHQQGVGRSLREIEDSTMPIDERLDRT